MKPLLRLAVKIFQVCARRLALMTLIYLGGVFPLYTPPHQLSSQKKSCGYKKEIITKSYHLSGVPARGASHEYVFSCRLGSVAKFTDYTR